MNTRPKAAADCIACQRGECAYMRLCACMQKRQHTEASIDRHFQGLLLSGVTSIADGYESYKTVLPVMCGEGSDAWRRAFLAPSMFFYGKGPNVTCHLLVEEDPLEPLEGHVTVVFSYFGG